MPTTTHAASASSSRRRIMDVAEAAEYLRIHPVTVRRLVQRGELPAAKVGDMLRIREEDLESLFK
jgi:excisionase family DNA binding protein